MYAAATRGAAAWELRSSVDAELATLETEQAAVVYPRRMDAGTTVPVRDDRQAGLDDHLAVPIALRDERKIGAIALSSVTDRPPFVGPPRVRVRGLVLVATYRGPRPGAA